MTFNVLKSKKTFAIILLQRGIGMTERDEQGFVKDIKVAISEIGNENKSSKEKVQELIELPFKVEDVLDVVNFVNQETSEEVDVRDELYNLAILNEQLVGFDDMFKSKLEERHKVLVEALMNRMEGVFKMYDENVNVPKNPEMERPVEVQTPQLSEFNPEASVEQVATLDNPEVVVPTVDPMAFAAPTGYGEVPEMVATEASIIPETSEVESYAAPVEEVTVNEEEKEQEPAQTVETSEDDFMKLLNSLPADFYQEPEEAQPVAEEVADAPAEEVAETPVETYTESEETTEVNPFDAVSYTEPEQTVEESVQEEAPVAEEEPVEAEAEEDEEVRKIINLYDRLKSLKINVHNNQKKLAKLQQQAAEVESQIAKDNEEINSLAAQLIIVNATNKKFLKDNFNIDADDYSPETLKKVLDIIDKNIKLETDNVINKNKELEALIEYYMAYLNNN